MELDQHNTVMESLTALTDQVDTPGELYSILLSVNAIVAQRASEIRNSLKTDTEEFGFAVQVHKDSTKASDNAERMHDWIASTGL